MKTVILVIVLALIVFSIFYLEAKKPERVELANTTRITDVIDETGKENDATINNPTKLIMDKSKKYEKAEEIKNPSGFVNTDKITIHELVGKKVILVDFWTYSCINCQRTIPYLNAWYEKYKDKGLEIVSIHTPEFEFEKNHDNVAQAVKKFGIKYPVAQDNNYETWRAYGNRYWPHKYLIDIDGYVVYDHIGEGFYDETEKKIQELLKERMEKLGVEGEVASDIVKPAVQEETDFNEVKSPEIYFGGARNLYLGNGKSETLGEQNLSEPTGVKANILYLAGNWNFEKEFAENLNTPSKIIFRYRGKNVYFVGKSINGAKIKILIDGKEVGDIKGADVVSKNGESYVNIKEERLYKIIKDKEYTEHTLEMLIEEKGLRAFTFTFG